MFTRTFYGLYKQKHFSYLSFLDNNDISKLKWKSLVGLIPGGISRRKRNILGSLVASTLDLATMGQLRSLKTQVSQHMGNINNKINEMVTVINDNENMMKALINKSDAMVDGIQNLEKSVNALMRDVNVGNKVNILLSDFVLALIQSGKSKE